MTRISCSGLRIVSIAILNVIAWIPMRTIAEVCHYTVLSALESRASSRPPCWVSGRVPQVRRCATLWERWDQAAEGLNPDRQDQHRAIGSAGERLVHTEEVTGSIPVSPTSSEAMWIFAKISTGAIPVAK